MKSRWGQRFTEAALVQAQGSADSTECLHIHIHTRANNGRLIYISSVGTGWRCALPMRMPDPNPILYTNPAPTDGSRFFFQFWSWGLEEGSWGLFLTPVLHPVMCNTLFKAITWSGYARGMLRRNSFLEVLLPWKHSKTRHTEVPRRHKGSS